MTILAPKALVTWATHLRNLQNAALAIFGDHFCDLIQRNATHTIRLFGVTRMEYTS